MFEPSVAFNLDIHAYGYHKYSDTLNTLRHAMSFKQRKVTFKGSN